MRAAVVNQVSLARAARDIGLGLAVRLGKGEEQGGGRDKPSILSDTLEAVFGAVYLDGGWDHGCAAVLAVMGSTILSPELVDGGADFKTRLQELAAARFGNDSPIYDIESTGPDHAKEFRATVRISGKVYGDGRGRSKKEAEQAAAGEAFAVLTDDAEPTTTQMSGGGPTNDA